MQQLPLYRKISVIGLGYIGLPTAAMFASKGVEVVGVDVDARIVDMINQGRIHIVEPDLDVFVEAAVKKGFLRATSKPEPADAFLIAVPTPFKGENREPDLSYIKAATQSIAEVLKTGDLVILESTSPVGATAAMANWLSELRPDLTFPQAEGVASDIRIAHCPERVLPGKVIKELVSNDRIIGGMTKRCSEEATRLYKTFVTGNCITASNPSVAEMAKLTENSFRDVNIAFANELSIICDDLNIDVWELIGLANRHPRVNILQPGPGVGGHCIAVDPWFIVHSAPDRAKLIKSARNVNDYKIEWVIEKIKRISMEISKIPSVKTRIACFGLTFKPDIDDLRESPALRIVEFLSKQTNLEVYVVEPNIDDLKEGINASLVEASTAFELADVIVLLVDHKGFHGLTPPANKPLIDTRGIWPMAN
jgi:UDP-N-acetyl-D-mannosaminuronic acid dehydrogenase